MTIDRERIGEVLTDFRDGLLDSIEDAIDAIIEAAAATAPPSTPAALHTSST